MQTAFKSLDAISLPVTKSLTYRDQVKLPSTSKEVLIAELKTVPTVSTKVATNGEAYVKLEAKQLEAYFAFLNKNSIVYLSTLAVKQGNEPEIQAALKSAGALK